MFLVRMSATLPVSFTPEVAQDHDLRERSHVRELQSANVVRGLWKEVGGRVTVGVFEVRDNHHLNEIISGFPTAPFADVSVTPLVDHPHMH